MKQIYLKDVTTLRLDTGKCNGCGICLQVCPHAVFQMRSRKAFISDKDACMECGACSRNCKPKAISVTAGVGCAAALTIAALTGKEPSCGPDTAKSGSSASKASCGCSGAGKVAASW